MAISFNEGVYGTSGFINCGSQSILNDAAPLTISFWYKPTGAGTNGFGIPVAKEEFNTNYSVWEIFHNGVVGQIGFDSKYGTGNAVSRYTSSNTIVVNVWQHICVTWNGSNNAGGIRIYRNGNEVLYHEALSSNSTGSRVTDSINKFYIGNVGGGFDTIAGSISEVALWNSAILSLNQIKLLASADIKGIPLQIIPPTGGLAGYWPLDEFSDLQVCTGSFAVRDRSKNINHGTPNFGTGGNLPKGSSEQVLSYQP